MMHTGAMVKEEESLKDLKERLLNTKRTGVSKEIKALIKEYHLDALVDKKDLEEVKDRLETLYRRARASHKLPDSTLKSIHETAIEIDGILKR